MPLNHDWIASHIPHQRRMCLLDRVIDWDATRVRCAATNHRDPDHPLRAHGRLGAGCGIEYAAQAMAVHGVLCAAGIDPAGESAAKPGPGMLASVRGVEVHASRLDDIDDDLIVDVQWVSGDAGAIAYKFELSAAGRVLLSGRATVMLGAAPRG